MLRSLQKIVRGRYAERHDERDEIGRRESELAAESARGVARCGHLAFGAG